MASKTGVEEFTSSWNKTVNWAKQSGIPQSAYYPVYQLDSQRMLSSGSGMSESERVRAIQASAGLNYSSALPTDTKSDSNVVANVKSNAANIFTGLEPTHLITNIFDTVKNTIEHPSSIFHPLDPHSIASWIPGVTDAALLLQGKKGLDQILQNPLTSLLDVLPIADYAPGLLAGTAQGAEIASKLGISTDELAKLKAPQLAWRLSKSSSKGISPQSVIAASRVLPDGTLDTTLKQKSWGDIINGYRNAKNVGSEQSELNKGLAQSEQEGSKLIQEITEPMLDAMGKLSGPDKIAAKKIMQTDFRSVSDIENDNSIPQSVRDALVPTFKVINKLEEIRMQHGEMGSFRTRLQDANGNIVDSVEKYLVKGKGEKVNVAGKLERDAMSDLQSGAEHFNYLTDKVNQSDKSLDRFIQQLHGTSSGVFQAIKASIPNLPDDAAERARQALPTAERWDRSVPTNTIVLRNLLGLGPDTVISLHAMNGIRDLFSPGGLLDHIYQSYQDHDFKAMSDYAKVASRKFDNKVFQHLPGGPNAHLLQIRNTVKGLELYGKQRTKLMDQMDRLWNGKSPKDRKSVAYLAKRYEKASQHFLKVSIQNPPDVWDSAYLQALTHQIDISEKTASLVKDTTAALQKRNPDAWTDDNISKLRADTRTIAELSSRSSKDAYGNPSLPDIPVGTWKELNNNALLELSSLRARGLVPHYIPRLTSNDIKEGATPTYTLKLSTLHPKSEAALKARIFDYKSSVFDIGLGLLKATKEAVHDDILQDFHDTYVKPFLHDGASLRAQLTDYLSSDIAMNAAKNVAGTSTHSTEALLQAQIKNMGLVTWDPHSIFGNLSMPKLSSEQYIHGDLAKAMSDTVQHMDNPANTIYDRGTKVFRYSILGLSPRFTAHIVFGGAFLVALRANKEMVPFFQDAIHYARTGNLTDATKLRYPEMQDQMTSSSFGLSSSQEGAEVREFHRVGAKNMGDLVKQEFLANHPNLQGALGHLKAAADINFRFTRAVTRAQKSLVYMAGYEKALKGETFFEDKYTPSLDTEGNPLTHPTTGRQVYTHSREEVKMTPEQAHEEGMQAAMSVMGDLRHMTPLERNVLLRVFPFYGWTKHILSYVLSYPADHPYRAMFLSQLATQNSADVASGLPTRIQLLFFLGQPDAQGNVSAVDDRFLDPLRDTANYASFTGLFESLNPVLTAPLAAVDPSISFGGVPLYPNVTFDSMYGIKEAGAQGNRLSSLEQVVPELSALSIAGQFSYLKKNNPGGFTKMLANALNVPFADVQHINVRQIAAKAEISRYSIAENDAYNALNTGDFSTLDKYPANATVPDPMGTGYNVTPAYLKALYDQTEKQYGLPPTEVLKPLPQPAL